MDASADRRGGLVVFGILQLVLGLLATVTVLVVASGQELAARQSGQAGAGTALASAVVVYGVAAVYFVAVGIGSIRGRRWARALSVVVSAIWGVAGVVGGVMLAIVLPRVLRAYGSAPASVGGIAVAMILVCGIALPLALFLFYRRDDVRLTCERMDAKPRWTDRVPLPVLAVVLVFAFAAVSLLANLASPTFAVLGREVSGAPAALALLAFAALSAVVDVQLYRLKESAWWILILLQLGGVAYATATIVGSVRAAASGPAAEVAAIYRDPLFLSLFAATWIGYFAFLLYLRRFFVLQRGPRTRAADQSRLSA